MTKVYRNTVLLNPEMSDMEILNIVDEALKNKKEYYKRAKNLSLFIRENYSAKSVAHSMAERINFLVNSGNYHNKFIPKTKGNYFSEIFHL